MQGVALLSMLFLGACSSEKNDSEGKKPVLPEGKALYRPEEFSGQDWYTDDNEYSYNRMACTDNLAIFWGKGFGSDPTNAPQLEGNNMNIDLDNMKNRLEYFYTFFHDTLEFVKPGTKSNSDDYRMMVMVMYSLEGTAYGGTYDDFIGAFWAAPNRLQDKKLNTVAHELGHSFQLQIIADKQGEAWGGSGFFEMTSQWMLWQVNPEWVTDENYHFVEFKKKLHKAYLHMENIYRSPYVLEYWGQKHGRPLIAELYRQGKQGEDPVMTYKEVTGITQEQFNDEMIDCYLHFVNMDFPRVFSVTREWANSFEPFASNLADAGDGWKQVKPEVCPENYGFNVIKLAVPEAGGTVTVDFCGLPEAEGYQLLHTDKAGWRYGLVGVDAEGRTVLAAEPFGKNAEGSITFTAPSDRKLAHLWLVVMGAPTEHWMNSVPERRRDEASGQPQKKAAEQDAQWPYRVKVTGSQIL